MIYTSIRVDRLIVSAFDAALIRNIRFATAAAVAATVLSLAQIVYCLVAAC